VGLASAVLALGLVTDLILRLWGRSDPSFVHRLEPLSLLLGILVWDSADGVMPPAVDDLVWLWSDDDPVHCTATVGVSGPIPRVKSGETARCSVEIVPQYL
jgi:hypothetical protein